MWFRIAEPIVGGEGGGHHYGNDGNNDQKLFKENLKWHNPHVVYILE